MKLLVPFAACGLIFGSLMASHGGPCSYSLSPTSASFSSADGAGAFNVTAGSTCSWTATTTNSWIHTASTGSGNGTVNYTVDANGGTSQRVGAITVSKQTFTVNQTVSLAVALDNTNLIWVTSADYPWYSATDVTYDGVDAAASGNQYVHDSTSWLQTTVVGPGTLSFWWKVNTDPSDDLEFYIGGALQDQITGLADWSYRTYAIPPGTNVLQWQYVKVGSVNFGTDRGWLDQVIYTTNPPIALQDALDTCGITWISGGNSSPTYWAGQTNVSHDGKSAAQSGAIYTSQESWMQAVVSGVTNVSFWWQVSSQTNDDFLEFYTNGVLARRISGTVNWQSNFFKLPTTTNTLRWRYFMTTFVDPSLPLGQNAGWVDQVAFNPPNTMLSAVTVLGNNPMTVECHMSFTDPGATAQDCAGVASLTTNGTVNPNVLGSYVLQYVATDPSGNSATNTRTVNVVDTTPPQLTLNGSDPVTIECHGVFTDPGATAQDACAGTLGVVTNGSVDPNLPGAYTIQYVATDPSGNSATNARSVNVVDTIPPEITLNGSNALTIECHGVFTDPGATALDACAGTLDVVTNGSVGPNLPGAYTIQYVATDPSGNSATNTRTVNVVDTTPPQVSLNGSNPLTIECHGVFTDPGATALDDCAGTLDVVTNGPVNSDLPGAYTIQYVATDPSGNSATNTRSVNVVDTMPPVIQYSFTNLTLASDSNCTATLPDLTLTNYILAVDNCSSVTITQSPPTGAMLSLGTNQVVLTVFDTSGNSVAITNTIVVVDVTPPFLVSPSNLLVTADPGLCSTTNVVLGSPTFGDNCGGVTVTNDAPSVFPVGTNLVTWTATDGQGNTTNAIQVVVVQDMERPLIIAPDTVTVSADPGTNYASAVNLGTPLTSDNCGVAGVTNDAPGSFPLGTNVVNWTALDIHGNEASAIQQVVVNPAPRLPHRITSIVNNRDGTYTLGFAGTSNVEYVVQVSLNLVDWVPVHTNVAAPDGTWTYTDTAAAGSASRFYRSVQP